MGVNDVVVSGAGTRFSKLLAPAQGTSSNTLTCNTLNTNRNTTLPAALLTKTLL